MIHKNHEVVIGLEIHLQLGTRSKAFCGDAVAFGEAPNTQVSPISLGHPGTLPRLNARQVEYALRLGLALGSRINRRTTFDRKNYFYADLPKGYQITQDRTPICVGGGVPIVVGGREKIVRLHHIHMEEDAGKLIHDQSPEHSFIDLNRAGSPLLEIVTEPDLRSPEEVDVLMYAMRQLARYLEISEANMEQGAMRCDLNVSVRPLGDERLGQRCEIKNVNSMRYARRAIEYEVRRQVDILEAGGQVRQQTLNFDPTTGVTTPLREKEEAQDYRYFPEPDLPPVMLSEAYIAEIEAQLPPLPWALLKRLREEYGLSPHDANLICEDKAAALFFLELTRHSANHKAAANLLINRILPYCDEKRKSIAEFPVSIEKLARLIALVDEGTVSNTAAYQKLFPELLARPEHDPLELAQLLNLLRSADAGDLAILVDAALEAHPDKVSAYRKGKKGLLGFFVGEVMKQSKGKADPKVVNDLLIEKLK
jgi:aspartyl-tRNA(Asn)/glutamyl-tRNA(Gln) amidotransferase subunit B